MNDSTPAQETISFTKSQSGSIATHQCRTSEEAESLIAALKVNGIRATNLEGNVVAVGHACFAKLTGEVYELKNRPEELTPLRSAMLPGSDALRNRHPNGRDGKGLYRV